jgi:dihydroorotase
MTIKLTGATTPAMIEDAKAAGIIAIKLYPAGVTTNSADGVSVENIEELFPIFQIMQDQDIVLSIHGELPNKYVLLREELFLVKLAQIALSFPRLRIVLEHITTQAAATAVCKLPKNVAATITLHHMMITLDDVLCDKQGGGEFLNPHHYCKPIAKSPADRWALLEAAASGNPKFFFGSDTAPHLREKKESACGCAGVWSPVLLPLLALVFEKHEMLNRLEPFISQFGAEFYRLPLNSGKITLTECEPIIVPPIINGIVPFWAGKELKWSVS